MIHRLRVFHQMTAAEIQIKHKVASMKIFSEFPIMYDTLSTAYCSHNDTFVCVRHATRTSAILSFIR